MNFIQSNLNNLLAIAWFVACWGGYTRYAIWKGRDTACLASVLHLYREDWMRRMLLRDNRIADASVIGNLERNASFFCLQHADYPCRHSDCARRFGPRAVAAG